MEYKILITEDNEQHREYAKKIIAEHYFIYKEEQK